MNIAIDFDGTYTKAPIMWNSIIDIMTKRDHKVFCVTMRYGYLVTDKSKRFVDDLEDEMKDVLNTIGLLCPVIFTNRQGKKKYLKDLGINIDIWIDDNPEFILYDAF